MQLTQLPNISRTIITALSVAGWTVEKIATTTPDRLAALPGIGTVTANKLIGEAQKLVNKVLFEESAKTMPPIYPGGVPVYNTIEPVKRSVRVQRIREAMQ